MSYKVIARRWRPQQFDDVVYQQHISQTLKNSIKNNRISHAYIFNGPRGVGKTTTARIFSKALNCLKGPTPEPCGVCENCIEITDGNSFDVIEIDGASNNSVDNIRDLREKVNFAPVKSKYKVYIIDEVHMLSIGAFNALLKTLEEPPDHTVFIFATTEIHKVPDTILSRCQKYNFKKIQTKAISDHLSNICKKESINLPEPIIYAIARNSDGAMRDAQSALEQVISFSGEDFDESNILLMLGIANSTSYFKIINAIVENDKQNALNEINNIIESGIDVERYISGFLEIITAVRLIKNKIQITDLSEYSDDELNNLNSLQNQMSNEELGLYFKILSQLKKDLKYADNEKIYFQMAIFDIFEIKNRPSISKLLNMLENDSMTEKKNLKIETKQTNEQVQHDIVEKKQCSTIKEAWSETAKKLKFTHQYLHQKLISCTITFSDNSINISPKAQTKGRIKISLDETDMKLLNSKLNELTDINFQINYLQSENNTPLPENQMIEDTEHDEIIEEDPVVKNVMDTFYGKIIKKK